MAGNQGRPRGRGRGPAGAVVALQQPLASWLTVVGGLLILLGLGRLLLVMEVLPPEVGALLADWWPIGLVLLGVWLTMSGRRVTGAFTLLVGLLLLAFRLVPDGFTGPALLIGLGVLFLVGAGGGWRWLVGEGPIALFDDVRARGDGDPPSRSFVAVFGESSGRLEPEADDVVECLAVFGDVEVQVPADLEVELAVTAVFGDVRDPGPPTQPVTGSVVVRATAIFGDVRLVRAIR